MLKMRRRLPLLAAAALVVTLPGCRARFVQATIINDSSQALTVVELDYPGAGFGVSTLAPNGVYSYRFKAIGSGPLTLSYTDAKGAAHTAAGPVVEDGQGGSLSVHIREGGTIRWDPALAHR